MPRDLHFRPLATFSGLRGVPLIALSHNSIFPSLTIRPQGVTIRVIRLHELRFDELDSVTLKWRLGHLVTFVPRSGLRTFSANFYGRQAAAAALAALHHWNAPLDAAARALLQGHRAPP